ncbi:hypothetical protein IAQ61_004406 [Plenodomus lingam]|uniref:uncharacterized protein n=1 Tax=Leptosphaeria maculans TaxID=5022 RepID=UPI00331C219C|nr:hypothetical protein IAQ61_004406 [Plenodomus lingam]
MSAFRDLMSIVDPSAPKTSTTSKPVAPAGASKPVSRPAGGANGASPSPQLKRKASGSVESSQAKIQRKEAASQTTANGVVRSTSTPAALKPTPAPVTTVPYRGTAAPSSMKTTSPAVRKPPTPASAPTAASKAAAPAPKPAPASTAAPKKGYLALLQKAKEKDATKPIAPPIKHEPTKILTKKERLALKAEASAGAKGKKPVAGLPSKAVDSKADASKRKPIEVGYQGTARPAKKPVEVGYKGTARPASAPASSSRNGTPAAKAKPAPGKGRYDGYADWDELDDLEDDEEDYESDASSVMEGGIWDVEQEEQLALKVAKKEDAEALAEEMRLKREKDARKQKLLAMSKAAAAKRRF